MVSNKQRNYIPKKKIQI